MNIGLFEDEIIKALSTNSDTTENKDILVAKYFGELSSPKKYKHTQDSKPHILIDFIKEDPVKNSIRSQYTFNIYVAHIAFSANEKIRIAKHKDIYSVLTYIDKKLSLNSFASSEPIKIDKTEKIYDSLTNQGYLTVYQKKITCVLSNL